MRRDYHNAIAPAAFRYPANALKFIATHYAQAKVANHWNYGSWMILYHRDQMHPMIDGRALTAYPDRLFLEHYKKESDLTPLAWERLLNAYPADVILWMVADQKQIEVLKLLRGWNAVYSDQVTVVFARSSVPTE